MRILAKIGLIAAAFAAAFLICFSDTSLSTSASTTPDAPAVALDVSKLSTPDVKVPYFLDLDTIITIRCYHFPDGVTLDNFKAQTPDVINKIEVASGTGTVFAHNRIVTAAHVLAGASVCAMDDNTLLKTVYTNTGQDIAVLSAELGSTPVTPISCEPLQKGSPYLLFGYAKGRDFAMDYAEFSGIYQDLVQYTDVNDKTGTAVAHEAVMPGALTPGMSGGPVIDLNGRIVAINNSTGESWSAVRQLADTALCTAIASQDAAAAATADKVS